MEGPEDTTIVARRGTRGWVSMFLSFILGLAASLAPGYYAVKQAKVEAAAAREEAKKEANAGYTTLANPLEQFRSAISILDWRVQRLEKEHETNESLSQISPQPLVEPALKNPVPQTLREANVASEKKE